MIRTIDNIIFYRKVNRGLLDIIKDLKEENNYLRSQLKPKREFMTFQLKPSKNKAI